MAAKSWEPWGFLEISTSFSCCSWLPGASVLASGSILLLSLLSSSLFLLLIVVVVVVPLSLVVVVVVVVLLLLLLLLLLLPISNNSSSSSSTTTTTTTTATHINITITTCAGHKPRRSGSIRGEVSGRSRQVAAYYYHYYQPGSCYDSSVSPRCCCDIAMNVVVGPGRGRLGKEVARERVPPADSAEKGARQPGYGQSPH